MIFLPIVVRELRTAARRKIMYRTRFWSVCAAVAFGCYILLMSGAFLGRAQGTMIFDSLAGLCFLSCLSLARNTIDCISEEKREGTLGFLFLTDLKGHDITLGKLFSASLISFYSLLGTLPIVAVSLLFGGISSTELWEVALGLLNVFFFSQAAGIFVSAFSWKRKTANFAAAAILLGYTAGFYFISLGLNLKGFARSADLFEWLNLAYCVHWACTNGFNPAGAFGARFGHYWASFLFIHLNAWFFLAMAGWWLPRCWQEKSAKSKIRWREQFLRWYHDRHTPRKVLLDINPFLWLSIRNRLGSITVWTVLIVVNGLWAWFLSRSNFRDAGLPIFISAILSNHLLLKIFVATEASATLEEQRHNGALEFLLSCTPLGTDDIVAGQWLALRRQLRWPIIVVIASDFAIMLVVLIHFIPKDHPIDEPMFIFFVLAIVVMLLADAITLGWVGMWNAMSQKKPRHAAGRTIAQVLFAPWIFLILIQTLTMLGQSPIIESFGAALTFWFLTGIAVDVFAVFMFRGRLLAEFRALAAAPIGEDIGILGRLGRFLGASLRPKPPQLQV